MAATLCNWVCIFLYPVSSLLADTWQNHVGRKQLLTNRIVQIPSNPLSFFLDDFLFLSKTVIFSLLKSFCQKVKFTWQGLELASKSGSAIWTTSCPANKRLRLACIFLRESSSTPRQTGLKDRSWTSWIPTTKRQIFLFFQHYAGK